jgi:DNA ligase-1
VLLNELVETSAAVSSAPGRRVKIAEIAALLRRAPISEIRVAVAFLSGELRQRHIGVGSAALSDLIRADRSGGTGPGAGAPDPADPVLTLTGADEVFVAIGTVTGSGSQAERRRLLGGLFSRATPREREFLVRLLSGDLRQGALEGVMTEAIAQAAEVPADDVRRAHQLGGSLAAAAVAALSGTGPGAGQHDQEAGTASQPARPQPARPEVSQEQSGGTQRARAALRGFGLQVGHPVRPMLAASAPSVAAALERVSPAAVEWKIDGIRVQAHKIAGKVTVFTRTLDDITGRVPEIAEAVGSLDASAVVLDGEAAALYPDGRPRPFQITSARAASHTDVGRQRAETPLTPFLFDLLHLDGTDLIDAPGSERYRQLSLVAPADLLIPRTVTSDPDAALAFFRDAVSRGHEGVVVKSLDAPYGAGRRGSEWIKVKPRHTLDLVVLAAEWGHGRRRGLLSNLHLGAREPATGDLVMLGKTFKGLTDEMLAWQTSRLLDLADPPRYLAESDHAAQYGIVRVRPELVLEIAFDGVQASRRYPGGLALRFARVVRFRPDKDPAEADTIDAVRSIWNNGAAAGP